MANITINQLVENKGTANELSDEQIKKLAYGIKYFSVTDTYTTWGKRVPDGATETMQYLRRRLAEIENQKKTAVQNHEQHLVTCDCGHTIPADTVMHASMGTACPNCYDRMSD